MGKFNFEIPEELHDKLRIHSVNKKEDMRDILIRLIKKEVDKNEGVN